MTSLTLQPGSRLPLRRHLLAMAGVSLLAAAALFAGHGYQDLLSMTANRAVDVSATQRYYPDLESLSRDADLVVTGHVVSRGDTHIVPRPTQPGGSARPGMSAGSLEALPAETRAQAQRAASNMHETANPIRGTPVTESTVRIDSVLHGSGSVGTSITVTQLGGLVELPTFPGGPMLKRTLVFEHDELMNVGQDHVLFLKAAPGGSYYVVGGTQGRFEVQAGKLRVAGQSSVVAKAYAGKTLESFVAEVARVK